MKKSGNHHRVLARRSVFLVGKDIAKSISPAIQNAAFQNIGSELKYDLFDVKEDQFEQKVSALLKSDTLRGLNVTVPYKEKIINLLSEVDARASSIGAVNTVKVSDAGSFGYNTDYDGIILTLEHLGHGIPWTGKLGVVLGAGGAARACVYALAKSGFGSILILNRTVQKASSLANRFSVDFPNVQIKAGALDLLSDYTRGIEKCDLLVNAISASRHDYFPVEIDFDKADPKLRVFDLGYREESIFLKAATRRGLEAIDGLTMLVEQAAKSIEIWTRVLPPRGPMSRAAKKALSERN